MRTVAFPYQSDPIAVDGGGEILVTARMAATGVPEILVNCPRDFVLSPAAAERLEHAIWRAREACEEEADHA